jgi:hypothetical protein
LYAYAPFGVVPTHDVWLTDACPEVKGTFAVDTRAGVAPGIMCGVYPTVGCTLPVIEPFRVDGALDDDAYSVAVSHLQSMVE